MHTLTDHQAAARTLGCQRFIKSYVTRTSAAEPIGSLQEGRMALSSVQGCHGQASNIGPVQQQHQSRIRVRSGRRRTETKHGIDV
jgi:hypothetical protein